MAATRQKSDVYVTVPRSHEVGWGHNKKTAPHGGGTPTRDLTNFNYAGVEMADSDSSRPIRVGAYLTPEYLAQTMGLPVEHVRKKLTHNNDEHQQKGDK